MENINGRPEITIIRQFTHNQRLYFLFSLKDNPYEFLYLIHTVEPIMALFFGLGFTDFLNSFNLNGSECFECDLGTRIKGGVSKDQDSSVEFHLSKENANNIIKTLKSEVQEKYRPYFTLFH